MLDVLRQYTIPCMLALVLHAGAVAALYSGWNPTQVQVREIKPRIVNSTLLFLEAKAKPQKQAPAPAKPVERKPEVRPEPKLVEPKIEEEQPDLEAIRREQELAAQRERLERLAESSFLDALQDEASDLEQSDAADAEDTVVQSYRFGIYQLVVANWSRPPSARNNMEAKLLVELVPTGDVVAVTITDSSGNGTFDRSAEAAVRKARRFEVPRESEIFERYFRRFTLVFRPEDLLR